MVAGGRDHGRTRRRGTGRLWGEDEAYGEDDQELGSVPAQDHSPRSDGAGFERRRSHVGPIGNHSGRSASLRGWPSIIAALERSPRGGAERTIPRLAYPWAWRNDRLYGASGRPAAGSQRP
jgi:hypothetical protein